MVSTPTDTLTPADVDVASVALPESTAVTEPGPAVVKGTRSEATPLARAAEPSAVEPSKNVTEPVAGPVPGGSTDTVAFSVTF